MYFNDLYENEYPRDFFNNRWNFNDFYASERPRHHRFHYGYHQRPQPQPQLQSHPHRFFKLCGEPHAIVHNPLEGILACVRSPDDIQYRWEHVH